MDLVNEDVFLVFKLFFPFFLVSLVELFCAWFTLCRLSCVILGHGAKRTKTKVSIRGDAARQSKGSRALRLAL